MGCALKIYFVNWITVYCFDVVMPPGENNIVIQFQDLIDNLVEQAEETGELPYATGSKASPLDFDAMPPSMFNAAVGHAMILLEMEGIPYRLVEKVME